MAKYDKTWATVEAEVKKELQSRFDSVADDELKKLGLDDGSSVLSGEKRNWLVVYLQMLAWRHKARELHGLLNPSAAVGKTSRAKGKRDQSSEIQKEHDKAKYEMMKSWRKKLNKKK